MVVNSPKIRWNEWELKHTDGIGTYVKFHDLDWQVIEEYSSPENRFIWDGMSQEEIIEACYNDILEQVFVEVDGNESDVCGLTDGDEDTHIYLHIDVVNAPIICYVNNIPSWNIHGIVDFKLSDYTDATQIRELLESDEFKELADALYDSVFNEDVVESIEYFLINNVVEHDSYEV